MVLVMQSEKRGVKIDPTLGLQGLRCFIKILKYTYVGHSESNEIQKNFCTSDNQFLIKFWLLTFSTMEILNPKVGTVPRYFEKYFW